MAKDGGCLIGMSTSLMENKKCFETALGAEPEDSAEHDLVMERAQSIQLVKLRKPSLKLGYRDRHDT